MELAICQVATELSQQASVEADVVTGWQQWMSYGFHEVKLFLATEAFDAARHFEVFRKRALINGGGIGRESPGEVNRWLLESRGGWTETSLLLHLFRGLFTRMVYRYLSAYAPTSVELLIGRRCAEDKTRHIAYAMQHLRYAVKNVRGTAGHINAGLAQAETFAARDERNPVLWECLACIFGGGVHGMDEGMKVVRKLRRDYVIDYLKHVGWVGLTTAAPWRLTTRPRWKLDAGLRLPLPPLRSIDGRLSAQRELDERASLRKLRLGRS